MAVKFVRWSIVVSMLLFLLAMPGAIYSCGPWFDEATFAFADAPQPSQAEFAAGKLGIVLPTLRRSYLIVAYRYLNGWKLDSKQQQDAIDVWNRNMSSTPRYGEHPAMDDWLKARSAMVSTPPIGFGEPYASVANSYQFFVNCQDEAFRVAAATLLDRIAKYGKQSDAVAAWVTAQDMVFSNCDRGDRAVPPVLDSSDPVLRTDRNYQIAAAQFYAGDFDSAAASFDAIARDPASPWMRYGAYLAARAVIRKATLKTLKDAEFDASTMQEARKRLEQVASDPHSVPMHEPAARLLEFVRFRTEPDKRVAELEQLLLQPDPGANFKQHLWDYVLLVSHGEQADDLSDWLRTIYTETTYEQPQGLKRSDVQSAAEHAVAKWREEHSLTWLIAALQLATPTDKSADELLKAASQVSTTSPGYLTARYYALRMMAAGKQRDAARKELDALLQQPTLPQGSRNLLNDERQKIATNLPDFLAHAAEVPNYVGLDLELAGEGYPPYESDQAKASRGKAFFNAYAAQILSRRLPLAQLAESARSKVLPSHLQREVARSTWTRAILLDDTTVADQMRPLLAELDKPLWQTMEPFRAAKDKDERHFAAILVLLHNPGLGASVRAGLLRSATLGEMDHFRDNWWCDDLGAGLSSTGTDKDPDLPFPPFASDEDKARVRKERDTMAPAGPAPNYLASRALAFAAHHPDDPRVPEALHLAVRSTRWGCTNSETTHWSERAFRLLHQRYPRSEWAEKTKYYF